MKAYVPKFDLARTQIFQPDDQARTAISLNGKKLPQNEEIGRANCFYKHEHKATRGRQGPGTKDPSEVTRRIGVSEYSPELS